MDNAKKNTKYLGDLCKELNIKTECTAPNTPQQNGRVETRFVVLRQMVMASFTNARLSEAGRKQLWTEAVKTMNLMYNIMLHNGNQVTPYEEVMKETSSLYPYLKEFGRVCYAGKREKIQRKWQDKSIKCIMLGYAKNHSPDTYRLLNIKTKKIICSRDVTWDDWVRPRLSEVITIKEELKTN